MSIVIRIEHNELAVIHNAVYDAQMPDRIDEIVFTLRCRVIAGYRIDIAELCYERRIW